MMTSQNAFFIFIKILIFLAVRGVKWQKMAQNDKKVLLIFKLGFTPCKAEQPLQGMELQEKETHKD